MYFIMLYHRVLYEFRHSSVPHSEQIQCEQLDGAGRRTNAVHPWIRSRSASGVNQGLDSEFVECLFWNRPLEWGHSTHQLSFCLKQLLSLENIQNVHTYTFLPKRISLFCNGCGHGYRPNSSTRLTRTGVSFLLNQYMCNLRAIELIYYYCSSIYVKDSCVVCSVLILFRFYILHFLTSTWKAAPTATLTFFRFMMVTAPLRTRLENIVAKTTHRSYLAHTIRCISGFALTTLSVVVVSVLLGRLRTQVGDGN